MSWFDRFKAAGKMELKASVVQEESTEEVRQAIETLVAKAVSGKVIRPGESMTIMTEGSIELGDIVITDAMWEIRVRRTL